MVKARPIRVSEEFRAFLKQRKKAIKDKYGINISDAKLTAIILKEFKDRKSEFKFKL